MSDPVTVVGAGIAGAACAVVLREHGVPVTLLDRGRAPGGRMASPELHGRRVDIGAGYFTVRDDEFAAVAGRWQRNGLAREWTDTFEVVAPHAATTSTTGPMRWATASGLRSLVRELLDGLDVTTTTLDALPDGHVVLAMPDPQAAAIGDLGDTVDYDPVIAVVCGFAERTWDFDAAAFVHDHPDLDFVADDGSRRGDDAAVLVAHSSAACAREHLTDPAGAIAPVVQALREVTTIGEPMWTHAHRWTYAKPAAAHTSTFDLAIRGGRLVGRAGDQWCPTGSPRVESAWRSGTDLGRGVVAAL